MTKKSCCFFGQLKLSSQKRGEVYESVSRQVSALIKDGYSDFLFGNWGDFEVVSRIAIMSLKKVNPHIRTVYYQKLVQMDAGKLLQRYDEVIPPIWDRGAYDFHNQIIIRNSDYCIFYVTNKTGEERKALQYAIDKNKAYVNLADLT